MPMASRLIRDRSSAGGRRRPPAGCRPRPPRGTAATASARPTSAGCRPARAGGRPAAARPPISCQTPTMKGAGATCTAAAPAATSAIAAVAANAHQTLRHMRAYGCMAGSFSWVTVDGRVEYAGTNGPGAARPALKHGPGAARPAGARSSAGGPAVAYPDQLRAGVARSPPRSRSGACACSWPARRPPDRPPWPGWRCRAAGRPTRTRARSSSPTSSCSMVRRWSGPWRSRADVVIATSAPTIRALTASVPAWIPEVAASETPGPSCGRRIAVQRSGQPQLRRAAQLQQGDDVEGLEVEVRLVEAVEEDEAVGAALHDLARRSSPAPSSTG